MDQLNSQMASVVNKPLMTVVRRIVAQPLDGKLANCCLAELAELAGFGRGSGPLGDHDGRTWVITEAPGVKTTATGRADLTPPQGVERVEEPLSPGRVWLNEFGIGVVPFSRHDQRVCRHGPATKPRLSPGI